MSGRGGHTIRKDIRRVIRRVLRRAGGLRSSSTARWVAVEEQPRSPQPLEDFRLFAIVCAWMEGDVIGATVANAFAQGCERVYLVDNASPDDTVEAAVAAGAVLAESFSTDRFEETLRFDIMNRVVREVSDAETDEHIWWLWLDADEFPHGPGGATVREHLTQLDRRFRIVGSRFINHFPDRQPAYVRGFHPLDFQSLGEEHTQGFCGHRKHSLQRYDRGRPPITCDLGIHRALSDERPLLEPTEPIFLHHFPYRDPTATRHRLATLCGVDDDGSSRVREDDRAVDGMVSRFDTLDAVYRGDWANVRNYRNDGAWSVARPVPWESLCSPEDLTVKRWYTLDDTNTGV
ncbi:MAG: hypothetical protein QOI55_1823 [Actinomycetota bacterium]|nr:hypothetical protein [Actinomycetota bacterium]